MPEGKNNNLSVKERYSNPINLGCGTDIKKDWINVDIIKAKNIDFIYDLNKNNWNIGSDYDYVLMDNVLEHLELESWKILRNINKIMSNAGTLDIIVPHNTSPDFFNEYHKKHFWFRSFDIHSNYYQEKQKDLMKKRDMKRHNLFLCEKKIIFQKRIFYNKLIEKVINSSDLFKSIYESTGLRFIFPAHKYFFRFIKDW